MKTDQIKDVIYDDEEENNDYWDNLALSEFWSKYDVVYQNTNARTDGKKTKLIPLKNGSYNWSKLLALPIV